MVKRTLTPLPKTVKETVDFIYEFLIVHPDGVQFSADSLGGSTQKRILSILVKRGIVERTWLLTGGTGRVGKYKWIATMQPTKTLYGSIVTEIREEQKAWPSHKKGAKSKQSVKDKSVAVDAPSNAAQTTPTEKVDDDKPTWTGWSLIEYKEKPGHFHYSKIMKSPKHGVFIYNGIGTYGWRPIAVIPPKADNARFSLFLSDIDEKNHSTEEIQSIFRKNIKPENIFGDNDELAEAMARIAPDKDIFIEAQEEEPTTVFTGFAPLDGFTDQELWDELKKRGYSIEENRLVIVKKTYLD